MPHDFIPRPDGTFNGWSNHFVEAAADWWTLQGFDPGDLGPLKNALEAWNLAFPAHVAAQAAAEAARQGKDTARTALEAEARPVARFVQS